jgi:serine/threonine protein kinase
MPLDTTILHLQNATYVKLDSFESDDHSEIWFVQKLDTIERYAIKIMDVHRAFDFKREIRALERLQGHPNIIRLMDKENHNGKYYMVLEMGDMDLARFIQMNGILDEESAKEMFVQMLDALAHCHSNRICHHDLKLENFLFDPRSRVVKLIDFGFSVDTNTSSLMVSEGDRSSNSRSTSSSFSSSYSTPYSASFSSSPSCCFLSPPSEIISGRYDWCSPLYASKQVLFQENHHFAKTDIFSLGVCLYFMLCGRFPFCSEDDQIETLKRTILESTEIDFPDVPLSWNAINLLRSMLARDEEDRCDLIDIFNHPWLTSTNVEFMMF